MNETIGRNAPCLCGSGKKYKKCCGAKEAVSITEMLESEIDNLQKDILQYAVYHYGEELEEDYREFEENFLVRDEEEQKFYELMHAIWFILFEPLEDGKTVLENFIRTGSSKIKRPKLREVLRSWTEARTLAGTVKAIENNKLMVEDGLHSEMLETIIVNKPFLIEEGTFVVGVLVPFEQNYVFYPAAFDLPELDPELAIHFIKESSPEFGYDSPAEFFQDFFLQILYDLPRIGMGNPIENLEWPATVYKEVAEMFQDELASQGESEHVINTGVILWSMFCEKKQKRIQNPAIYVAALQYLISQIVPVEIEFTQKELSEQYGVSRGALSSAYREIADELDQEINDLLKMMYSEDPINFNSPTSVVHHTNSSSASIQTERAMQEVMAELDEHDFQSIEEINAFMNQRLNQPAPKKVARTNKVSAQELIYDAFETQGVQRFKLAKKALELNPNCTDAYVILAELEGKPEDAAKMYEKGMKAAEKELGKAFFKENKGFFWGLFETRPYMRAKAYYAETLYHMGKIAEAAKQYEELLELNPNDNQGVRYLLFAVYMDLGNLQKAEELLREYDEDTAYILYNRLLLELYQNGFTAKAGKLLKDAKKQNKHVQAYLLGKKKLPKEMPDYYGFGDENEAIFYVGEHLHLWEKIDRLKEWLK